MSSGPSSSASCHAHFRQHYESASLAARVTQLEYENCMLHQLLRRMVAMATGDEDWAGGATGAEEQRGHGQGDYSSHLPRDAAEQVIFSRKANAACPVVNDAEEYFGREEAQVCEGEQVEKEEEGDFDGEDEYGYYDE